MKAERHIVVPGVLIAVALTLLALSCTGCQQLGLTPAETVNQKLAYSYVAVTQVRQTASGLLQQKQITVSDAKHVLAITDLARASLDKANALAQKPETQQQALKELEFANGIVLEVQKYLKQRSTI